MKRRDVLQVAGTTVGTVGIAGCSGVTIGGDDGPAVTPPEERGTYADWLGADSYSNGRLTATTVDFEVLEAREGRENVETWFYREVSDWPTDLLASLPRSYATLALQLMGPIDILVPDDEGHSIDRIHRIGGGLVVEGSFEGLTDHVGEMNFDEQRTYGTFTVYEGDRFVIAVSGGAILFVYRQDIHALYRDELAATFPAGDRIERLADLATGSRTPYGEAAPAFGTLVDSLPKRGIMSVSYDESGGLTADGSPVGSYGGDDGLAEFPDLKDLARNGDVAGDVVGVTTSTRVDAETGVETELLLSYASESAVDSESDVAATLGYTAQDQSVERDGRTVTVSGSYPWADGTE